MAEAYDGDVTPLQILEGAPVRARRSARVIRAGQEAGDPGMLNLAKVGEPQNSIDPLSRPPTPHPRESPPTSDTRFSCLRSRSTLAGRRLHYLSAQRSLTPQPGRQGCLLLSPVPASRPEWEALRPQLP